MFIVAVGPHAVRTGQLVYVNDSDLVLGPKDSKTPDSEQYPRHPDIQLRFYFDAMASVFPVQGGVVESSSEIVVTAYTAFFGADLTAPPPADTEPVRFGHGEGVYVTRDKSNPVGCLPYDRNFDSDAVLVYRGECTFLEKLTRARDAGASGVVVINDDEIGINPSHDAEEIAAVGDLRDVAIVALTCSAGKLVTSMLDVAEARGVGHVILNIDPEGQSATTDRRRLPEGIGRGWEDVDPSRVLYINGHALLNTRLLV